VATAAVFVTSGARVLGAARSGVLASTGWVGLVTIAGVHVGSLVLLLTAAYWGVFPPVL